MIKYLYKFENIGSGDKLFLVLRFVWCYLYERKRKEVVRGI